MIIDKKNGDWNLIYSNKLDDLAYYFFVKDFEIHNYYEYPGIPDQMSFMLIYKDTEYGIEFYKKSKHYYNIELRKQKIYKLNDKEC